MLINQKNLGNFEIILLAKNHFSRKKHLIIQQEYGYDMMCKISTAKTNIALNLILYTLSRRECGAE